MSTGRSTGATPPLHHMHSQRKQDTQPNEKHCNHFTQTLRCMRAQRCACGRNAFHFGPALPSRHPPRSTRWERRARTDRALKAQTRAQTHKCTRTRKLTHSLIHRIADSLTQSPNAFVTLDHSTTQSLTGSLIDSFTRLLRHCLTGSTFTPVCANARIYELARRLIQMHGHCSRQSLRAQHPRVRQRSWARRAKGPRARAA